MDWDGIKPPTRGVSSRRSIGELHSPLARAARIELASLSWKPRAPPVYQARWLREKDSNQRPTAYEANELTTALSRIMLRMVEGSLVHSQPPIPLDISIRNKLLIIHKNGEPCNSPGGSQTSIP